MAQSFAEKAHLNTNKKNFDEGWERVWGKKNSTLSSERHDGYHHDESDSESLEEAGIKPGEIIQVEEIE